MPLRRLIGIELATGTPSPTYDLAKATIAAHARRRSCALGDWFWHRPPKRSGPIHLSQVERVVLNALAKRMRLCRLNLISSNPWRATRVLLPHNVNRL
jgi:hypothetical protein